MKPNQKKTKNHPQKTSGGFQKSSPQQRYSKTFHAGQSAVPLGVGTIPPAAPQVQSGREPSSPLCCSHLAAAAPFQVLLKESHCWIMATLCWARGKNTSKDATLAER